MRFLLSSCLLAILTVAGIPARERETLVAFRLDNQRVVATVKSEINDSLPQLARDSPEPLAKYGYQIFNLPAELQSLVPSSIRVGDRWNLHTAPGQRFGAMAERIVLGEGGCSHLIGIVLKVDDAQADAFAAVRPKYYVATGAGEDVEAASASLGELPKSTLTPEIRSAIETTLRVLLKRELPAVRAEANGWLARSAESADAPDRSWARGLLQAHDDLANGGGTLTYDAQPYRHARWRAADLRARGLASGKPAGICRSNLGAGRHRRDRLEKPAAGLVDHDA